jgi:hypothetical protein
MDSSNLHKFLFNEYIIQQYKNGIPNNYNNVLTCCNNNIAKNKTIYAGNVDSSLTSLMRISQLVNQNVGKIINYGDTSVIPSARFNLGVEGQPGGLPRPLRNKF